MKKLYKLRIFLFPVEHLRKGWFIIFATFIFGCSDTIVNYSEIEREPEISPDYSGITIPVNIAPLNFLIKEDADRYLVKICDQEGEGIKISSADGDIRFPLKKWKKLIEKCAGREMITEVMIKNDDEWFKFRPIVNHVVTDTIDSHLVYRLIYPGYEIWYKHGIYQRNLENFDERPIMINEMSGRNCMNCHIFANNQSNTMLFHMRGKYAGTIIYRNGEISKVNTKTASTISAGVYNAWHPNGRYVAFSVNDIMQFFHASTYKKVEVIDTLSDLILFDAEKNIVSTCPPIASKDKYETFPSWSPDGRYMYFCSSRAVPATSYNKMQYDILRIEFDPDTRQFGKTDTVVFASAKGLSASYPRISPDGKFLLFCLSEYGNFLTWHPDSDLYTMNLETNEITKPEINSDESESFHSWSSTSRWIVFSSRRNDGFLARPFLAYFDRDGKGYKPFILPQKDPKFYGKLLECYNLPEFVTSRVALNPRIIAKINNLKAVDATFEVCNQSVQQ